MNETQDQQASQGTSNPTQDDIFIRISQYSFDSDSDYLNGLSSILGHPSVPPSASEIYNNADLVLQAKCFYFTRKHEFPPVDPSAYRSWLQSRPSGDATSFPVAGQSSHISTAAPTDESTATSADVPPSLAATSPGSDQPPPYPTSFAAIVDLITRNVPVPGIEEIPDTVLDHGSSKVDNTARRRKPWETEPESTGESQSAAAAEEGTARTGQAQDRVNGHLATGEGVVKILQPNAIADSGLLAREE